MKPLAVSLGDPAGIGPEVIVEAWAQRAKAGLTPFFVIGGADVLAKAAQMRGLTVEVVRILNSEDAATIWPEAIPVLGTKDAQYTPGRPESDGAHLALHSLVEATSRAALGEAGGLVTAPISKSELAQAGFTQPGQTEFLADAFGRPREDAVMMLAGPQLRAVPLTVHCALADVPELLTRDLIAHKARIVEAALMLDFGITKPRIAVCGLNPHAGEDGRFGDEDQFIIAPAIAELETAGMDISGPHPADALFSPRGRKAFDAALAMYHDQALIPVKALDFDQGVNVTLGLPIVRTSPDHGTAVDIAGTGKADPGAMIAALRMASDMVRRRAAHG